MAGYCCGRAEKPFAAGNIHKSFINGNLLHNRRNTGQNFHYFLRIGPVLGHVPRNNDQMVAFFPCLEYRHGGPDAVLSGLIASSGNNTSF